jgi:hypothetical protein
MIENQSPHWVKAVNLLLLIWNLIGVGFFLSQYMMSPADIAKLPSLQQYLWTHMTAYVWVAYAIAVTAGVIGAVGLMMRQGWSVWMFLVSLIALLVQFSNPILLDTAAKTGWSLMAFPAFIIFVAMIQLMVAWQWKRKEWLT